MIVNHSNKEGREMGKNHIFWPHNAENLEKEFYKKSIRRLHDILVFSSGKNVFVDFQSLGSGRHVSAIPSSLVSQLCATYLPCEVDARMIHKTICPKNIMLIDSS